MHVSTYVVAKVSVAMKLIKTEKLIAADQGKL